MADAEYLAAFQQVVMPVAYEVKQQTCGSFLFDELKSRISQK